MQPFFYVLILSLLLSGAGCASSPDVLIDESPTAKLSSYRSFAFYDRLGTDRLRYSTLLSSRLEGAAAVELTLHGYELDEVQPELRVNFLLNIVERQQVSAPRSGFYPYRAGRSTVWTAYPYAAVDVDHYQTGTLVIDLVDTRTNALVWRGIAEGRVSQRAYRTPDESIQAAVSEILQHLPEAIARS